MLTNESMVNKNQAFYKPEKRGSRLRTYLEL